MFPAPHGKDLTSKVIAGGRAFPATSFGISCAMSVEAGRGLLCLPAPEAAGLQGFTLQAPAPIHQGGHAGMDLPAAVLLSAVFIRGQMQPG